MNIAILHYSIPPVVGGVEAVIQAHAGLLLAAGYPVTLIAGAGELAALPKGTGFIKIEEMDSRHPQVTEISRQLEAGENPAQFEALKIALASKLQHTCEPFDTILVHNIFSKHFNLPLTAALFDLLDQGLVKNCIAWCHDISWTSDHARAKVFPGYPWDLLRTYREDITYVVVSNARQGELAGLFHCPAEQIRVIYNGVDPRELYSLSVEGQALVERLELGEADLILLMPVRITQAKNIELALQVVASLKGRGIRPKLVVTGPPDPHDRGDMEYYQSLLEARRHFGVEQEARFVYGSGPNPEIGYTIELPVVREMYRTCDALFMPSHREGFGMPILEAGLMGMPVFTTPIPAAEEIGGQDVIRFSSTDSPDRVAELILSWVKSSSTQQLRKRIRQRYTWQAIFQHDILPLLNEKR